VAIIDWTNVAPVVAAVLGFVGIVVGALADRRAKERTASAQIAVAKAQEAAVAAQAAAQQLAAKAADKAAEAAAQTAEAEMRKAVAAEREAQARQWAQITEGMQKWNMSLQDDIKENSRRIDDAELRAEADRERADRNERLYSRAIIYLRKLIRWIDDVVPGEEYPTIPPELKVDL
jgi:xanthosine utilization system XapX-like protein